MVTRILRDDPGKSTMHNVSTTWAKNDRLLNSYSDKLLLLDFCGKV